MTECAMLLMSLRNVLMKKVNVKHQMKFKQALILISLELFTINQIQAAITIN